ncbi:MAG: hypothetical protein ACOX3T_08355 [Bdellovibrionota bacterium]
MKQLGNSVAIRAVEAVANNIIDYLDKCVNCYESEQSFRKVVNG